MTDYKGLCRELVWLDQAEPMELYQGPGTFSTIEYARAVLARWGK